MKEKLKKLIDSKEAKLKELRDKVKVSEDVAELRGLSEDIDALIAELENLKEMYAEADEPAGGEGGEGGEGARSANFKPITNARGAKQNAKDDAQKRAEAFAASGRMNITNTEARAVLISGGKIATPTEVEGEIKEGLDAVSSIVDQVNAVDAEGMGAYLVPYEKADAEAAETAEGDEYNESDPDFGFVEVKPTTITVISYISKQVKKQTPVKYEEKVKSSALKALRKRASTLIVNAVKASDIAAIKTTASAKIDEKTLRNLCLAYGGDESVAGNAVLYLNKKDLIAFGDVRGTNEKKAIYEITPDTNNPNTGIIKEGGLSVKYCINKNCAALSEATAGADVVKTMMYGNPQNVHLALFSDYEVNVSEDFKINKGLLTIVGDAEIGAALTVKDGFVILGLEANA